MHWLLRYVIAVAVTFACLAALVLPHSSELRADFARGAVLSQGVVTALRCDQHATLEYAYSHAGRTYSNADLSPDDCSTYHVGQPLVVWQAREHPERSLLSNPRDRFANDLGALLFGAFLFPALMMAVARFRERWRP
ncbi:hypothetical protein [Phenylobacterium sp.]|uniref:hypothetical protein n=1 Tax=Phenylobacterium sp. TaxID=1871053 RepID=UPI003BACFFB8